MKLIFFGTAGAIQSANDANISFSVIQGKHSILLDASGNPAQYLLRQGIGASDLDALVLTHAHPDHLYALPSLIHNLWLLKRKRPLPILCNRHTETKSKQLIEVFSLFTRKAMFPMEWISLEAGAFHDIPGLTVSLFPVNHAIPTSGVRIATETSALVYSSDTAPSERVTAEATESKVLIHETTGCAENEKELNAEGHSTARQAGKSAERAGVETLYLCHFDFGQGPSLDELHREAQSVFKGKVIIPEHFMPYDI